MIATTQIHAMSRDGAEARTQNRLGMTATPVVVHARRFEYAAAPTKPVEGVVRDKDTGRPIAGVTLHAAVYRAQFLGPTEGTGLLPWSWAVWDQDHLCFSSSLGSRKIRNLRADPRCTITTENAASPVVVEGVAEIVTDPPALERLLALENAEYSTDYGIDMLDPTRNATVRVRPRWAFGLDSADFTGSPTRWVL